MALKVKFIIATKQSKEIKDSMTYSLPYVSSFLDLL
jgi:hypothetical protein